ncbi:MAG: RNA polymerase sigma factor [Saprospiraceae bacterium]|nr:RNA polymerase sigma factor [Saprospiraceae bacterium]
MDIALKNNSESEIITACINHERWAQRILYEEFYPSMMVVCLRYSNNREDALDILHDGFIKVFKYVDKYKQGTSLNAWMKRLMINTAIDFYRKRVRRRTENLDEVYNVSSKYPDIFSVLGAKDILRALSHLSPTYRAVFNLYVIEGYSHKEIAQKLKISESTSRSNLVKARARLRDLLSGRGFK